MTTLPLAVALFVFLPAQQVLDRVVLRFGSEIVTALDVRQARLLKLVDVPNDTDAAYVAALANRRLMLAEVRRSPPPEPAADAVDAKYRDWTRRVGDDPAGKLSRAGMTDTELRGWLRDDLRLEAYVAERFGGRPADLANWLGVLRQHAGLQ